MGEAIKEEIKAEIEKGIKEEFIVEADRETGGESKPQDLRRIFSFIP